MKAHTRPGGLSWAEYATVCQRLAEGAAVTSIAKELGRCEATLFDWLRRLDLVPPAKPRAKRRTAQVLEFTTLDQAWRKAA